MARRSSGFMTMLLRDALDEARLDRQLGGGASKRLARGDPLRLQRLEAELTERQVDARGRNPLDAAFVRLAELGAHRLQHGCSPLSVLMPGALTTRRDADAQPRLPPSSCPAPWDRV